MGRTAPKDDTANSESEGASERELSAEERLRRLDEAIERKEPLPQSELELARLFLARGRRDFARRRLELVLGEYPLSEAAEEARRLLGTL